MNARKTARFLLFAVGVAYIAYAGHVALFINDNVFSAFTGLAKTLALVIVGVGLVYAASKA